MREAVRLRPGQLDREEVADAGAEQQLRQRGGEAEAVGHPADRVVGAELAPEPALPVQQLAHERLARRHVAVGLDPHPADRLEPPRGGERGQPVQQLGVVLLQERVDLRRRLVEVQLGMALEQPDLRSTACAAPCAASRRAASARRGRGARGRSAAPRPPAGGAPRAGRARRRARRRPRPRTTRAWSSSPGGAGSMPSGSSHTFAKQRRVRLARDVVGGRARPVQPLQRARRGLHERRPGVVAVERLRRLVHQREAAHEALELRVDVDHARERQPRVAVRHPEREPGDDLDRRSRTAPARSGNSLCSASSPNAASSPPAYRSRTRPSPPRSSWSRRSATGHAAGGATSGCARRCTPVRSGHAAPSASGAPSNVQPGSVTRARCSQPRSSSMRTPSHSRRWAGVSTVNRPD